QSDRPRGRELTHNALVYFPDWRADEPLETVARAMAAMRRRKVSLVLIVGLPADALDSRRSDLEVRLRAVSDLFAGRLMVTVDEEGGWSHAFAVAGRPWAHLVNARRQFAWNSRGDVEPAAMAAALDKHRSAAFRSLLLQRLQTLQFPDAWRGPGLEEIQDDIAPAHPVQREAFSAFILDDDVRGAVAAAAGNLGLQRMGSWCRRGKKVFVERRRHLRR